MEELLEKLRRWRAGIEGNGLRVNLGKTKVMKCCEGAGLRENSGKFPCGVCGKGVGSWYELNPMLFVHGLDS